MKVPNGKRSALLAGPVSGDDLALTERSLDSRATVEESDGDGDVRYGSGAGDRSALRAGESHSTCSRSGSPGIRIEPAYMRSNFGFECTGYRAHVRTRRTHTQADDSG